MGFNSGFKGLIHILRKALISLLLELDMLRRPYYLCRLDHVRKIRDRKQRIVIGKYSFVNMTIKNCNQLHAEALGTFPCKPKIFRNRVRKVIINGLK